MTGECGIFGWAGLVVRVPNHCIPGVYKTHRNARACSADQKDSNEGERTASSSKSTRLRHRSKPKFDACLLHTWEGPSSGEGIQIDSELFGGWSTR